MSLEFGLGVSRLQDRSGDNISTPEQIKEGRAKAWVCFNGATTLVFIRDSFNVSSITDNGTGDYTMNFQEPMLDAFYPLIGMTTGRTDSAFCFGLYGTDGTNPLNKTANGVRVMTGTAAGTKYDVGSLSLIIFGDK